MGGQMFGRHRGVAVRSLTNIYSLVQTILDVSTKILEHGGEYLSVANGAILHVYCVQSRVEGLLREKNWTHVMLCQIVMGPQFQNFTLKCCFLAQRRASEHLDVTLKWAIF